MKKFLALLLIVCILFSLCACGKSKAAKEADELILAIGEVTLEKAESINTAERCYDALTTEQKEEVENYAILESSVQKLHALQAAALKEEAISLFKSGNYEKALIKFKELEQTDEIKEYIRKSGLFALHEYIVQTGVHHEDESESYYYIYKQVAANQVYYLEARDGVVAFADLASSDTSKSKFIYGCKFFIYEDGNRTFEFRYGDFEMYDGIAIGGESANIIGDVIDNQITVTSERSIECDTKDFYDDIQRELENCEEYTKEVLAKVSVEIDYQNLFI